MQVKRKKLIAMLCAAAVMTSAGGLPLDSGGLFDTTVTASAECYKAVSGNSTNITYSADDGHVISVVTDFTYVDSGDIANNPGTRYYNMIFTTDQEKTTSLTTEWQGGKSFSDIAQQIDSESIYNNSNSGSSNIQYERITNAQANELANTTVYYDTGYNTKVTGTYTLTDPTILDQFQDGVTYYGLLCSSTGNGVWYTGVYSEVVYHSIKPVHTHSFSYTANGNTITAECTDGCDITNGLTMTISAPTVLEYDGNPKEATLSTNYNTTAFPDTYTIEYYSGTTKLSGAPTNKGSYTAKVTAGNATASVEFTITKTVPYISYTYNDNGITASSEQQCQTYTSVTSSTTTWNNGWYVVDSNVTISGRVTANGNNVNLILCNGCTLNVEGGIKVESGKKLTVYAQSEKTNTMGVLKAKDVVDTSENAGIGGNNGKAAGTIIINGGKIYTRGSKNTSNNGAGAGIGGGHNGAGGTVYINGGYVSIPQVKAVAGIGGGSQASGGKIVINGGTVSAGSYAGSAIGCGWNSSGATVYINGGTVTGNTYTSGWGIGGKNSSVRITGGTISASATDTGYALGGTGAKVTITGGIVTAYSKSKNAIEQTITFGNNMVAVSGKENDFSKSLPCFDYPSKKGKYVKVWEHTHSLSYECVENHFAVKCANDNCNLINGELGLTLYADDKIYDGTAYDLQHSDCDSFAHTFADEFKLLTGNTVSIGKIELYKDDSKISAAINAGSYTAKQNITVGSTTYTVVKDFNIISTDPAYTVTIPATVDLGGAPATVSIDSMENIPTGKSVRVTIEGDTDGNFTVEQADDKLSYTITGTRPSHLNAEPDDTTQLDVKDSDEILHVDGADDTGNPRYIELKFNEPEQEPKYAGDYTGTVTFNVSLS